MFFMILKSVLVRAAEMVSNGKPKVIDPMSIEDIRCLQGTDDHIVNDKILRLFFYI